MNNELIVLALTCLMIWSAHINVFVVGFDECAARLKSCPAENSICNDADENTNGTARCICKPGFTGNGADCTDIDECLDVGICPDKTRTQCENKPGTYDCLCKPEYNNEVNGTCEDVDECAVGKDNCHEDANCINHAGGYNCSCKSGFTGDGKSSCTDINECKGDHECHSNATCENTPGSYVCVCKIRVEQRYNCHVSSYCPTGSPEIQDKNKNGECKDNDDSNNDYDTVVILVSTIMALLILCLVALIIVIFLILTMKTTKMSKEETVALQSKTQI